MPTFDPTNYEGQDRLSHIEKYLQSPSTDSLIRHQLTTLARGVISESHPFTVNNASVALTASQAHGGMVGLRKGDVVSNIILYIGTAQAPGIFMAGLYKKDGSHLGHTASLGASITGSLFWTAPLTSAVTITADDAYYVAVTSQGTATQPAIGGIGTGIPQPNPLSGGLRSQVGTSSTSLDMSGTLTFDQGPPGHKVLWYAVS